MTTRLILLRHRRFAARLLFMKEIDECVRALSAYGNWQVYN